MSTAWRLAASSVMGTAHVKRGSVCQDAHTWELLDAPGETVLVAVLADGAGSARRAEVGARFACRHILAAITALLAEGTNPREIGRGQIEVWLGQLRAAITDLAAGEGMFTREFSSTLLAAVIGQDNAMFFQVGDGAMVIPAVAGGFECVFWPEHEEYENVTYFAVDPLVAEHLQWVIVEHPVDELAMFSDGLQRLVLDYGQRQPHTPFFEAMLAPLRAATVDGAEALSRELATFLDSERVNTRTDDDKTLLLATRRSPSTAP